MTRLAAWLVAVALLAGGRAGAQTCTVATTPLSFGSYNAAATSPNDVSATITVSCLTVQPTSVSYAIRIGPGGSGNVGARSLAGLSVRLPYQVYTTAARNSVWGDGTAGSTTVGDGYALSALGSASRSYTAYGRIAARQFVLPGVYTDVLLLLVTY